MTGNEPVVLVTGGSRRVGAAIVQRLHREGWRVAIHYRASQPEAAALADAPQRVIPILSAGEAEVDRQTASPALRLLDELMSILDPGQGKIEWWGVVG